MFDKLRERIAFLRFHGLHRRSRAAIERWQEQHLQTMVRHVYRNVPMYHELYGSLDPALRTHPTLNDLPKFPVVLKSSYMGRPVEEYTDNSARVDGTWIKTSGTSGEPFTVLERTDLSRTHFAASVVYRAFTSHNPQWFLHKPRIARIMTKSPYQENRLFITMSDFHADPEGTVERVRNFKPEILESYASILYDFARIVEVSGTPLPLTYLISGGENMSEGMRAYFEKIFGCEAYNRYGMEEFTVVGMECAEHNGQHTNCESLIVEVVDEHGQPVHDGVSGRIVVTDLYNTAMPYVRYDTGDHGTMTWESCPCGNRAPRVWLDGRYSAWLSFDGKRINHLEYDLALDSFMNVILQYQVVKRSETDAVIMVVPGPGFSDAQQNKIIGNMQELLGTNVRVSVELVEKIPRVPRGKSQIVSDESR